jgi:hypothetical protein
MSKLTLRKKESEERYQQNKKGPVNLWEAESVYETLKYKVIKNAYPYDLAHEENLMLLTNDPIEKAFEYAKEFTDLHGDRYDQILWNTPGAQTQAHITHLHILRLRRI